jgi:hypothetical protein
MIVMPKENATDIDITTGHSQVLNSVSLDTNMGPHSTVLEKTSCKVTELFSLLRECRFLHLIIGISTAPDEFQF